MSSIVQPLSLGLLRERHGVSIPDLAEKCNVARGTIYGWLSRARGMGADDVHCVALALGLSDVEELALLRWAAEPKETSPAGDDPPTG